MTIDFFLKQLRREIFFSLVLKTDGQFLSIMGVSFAKDHFSSRKMGLSKVI